MSTPNPEQPAKTPRTDAVKIGPYKDFPYWEDFARQLERELNAALCYHCAHKDQLPGAAKQPVPDAGVRELKSLLQQMLDVAENCDETGYATDCGFVDLDKLHAKVRAALLLPAPTPATSEDTLMLDWLEKQLATISITRKGKCDVVYASRQALRAAMAHAGKEGAK